MEKGKNYWQLPLAPLFRLIPVQFMDNTQNLLWAFKPSKVEIINEHKRVREINELYIAICPELVSLEKYEAILHPDILLEPSFSFRRHKIIEIIGKSKRKDSCVLWYVSLKWGLNYNKLLSHEKSWFSSHLFPMRRR